MYHGEDSGHLMVHCNNKVMLIDFGVKDTKDYSFFLDAELFELKIVRESDGRYSYDMIHNEEVDSPYNRRREAEKKSDRWRIIAGVVLVVIIGVVAALFYFRAPAQRAKLLTGLAEGRGVDTQVSIYQKNDRWYANYRVDAEVKEVPLPELGDQSPLGFPLVAGDQFNARYAPTDPELIFVDWYNLVPAQLERYLLLSSAIHAEQHPELAARQIRCQLYLAIRLEGATGLAKIYQQNQKDHPEYNTDAYLRLVRSPEFKEGNRECL